jgi:hypothetical protein
MIRIEHVTLPAGLDAVAHRTAPGELYIVVSDLLEPGQQRAAVRAAIRAARRHAWEFGFLPLPLPLAAGLALPAAVRHVSAALRAHGVLAGITGTVAAAAAAVTAVMVVTSTPAVHPQHSAIARPAPAYSQPGGPGSPAPARSGPGSSAPGQPPGTKQRAITIATPRSVPHPTPQPSSTTSSTSPPAHQPPPTTTSPVTSPQPAPTPTSTSSSPPPSSGGGQTCLVLLGVVVCL